MTSIYGARHKQAVADARGKPPGWGTPGHANYNPPGRPGAYQPLDNSPLAASLLHQRSMAPNAPKIPPTDPPIPDPYGQRPQSLLYGNNMTPTPPQMNNPMPQQVGQMDFTPDAPKIPPTDPPEDPYGQRPPGYGGGYQGLAKALMDRGGISQTSPQGLFGPLHKRSFF